MLLHFQTADIAKEGTVKINVLITKTKTYPAVPEATGAGAGEGAGLSNWIILTTFISKYICNKSVIISGTHVAAGAWGVVVVETEVEVGVALAAGVCIEHAIIR